ncbi:hypothetical protein JTB14_029980 [Gonioctena quinquepunctata]|nr:hypothetical protein JTB14_029980 [Gonioctena quinquepunctata]
MTDNPTDNAETNEEMERNLPTRSRRQTQEGEHRGKQGQPRKESRWLEDQTHNNPRFHTHLRKQPTDGKKWTAGETEWHTGRGTAGKDTIKWSRRGHGNMESSQRHGHEWTPKVDTQHGERNTAHTEETPHTGKRE